MRMKRIALAAATTMALTLTACGGQGGSSSSSGDYPSEDMDWTIAFGPGGGNDIMTRTMVDILEKKDLYPANIAVENMDGGSGALGWGHLYSQTGSGYGISTTSGSFITTPMQADTGWKPTDFTPVGLMAADYALLMTAGDSDWQSYEDWIAYAKEQGTVTVGGIGTVNVDYIVQQMIADANGYDIDYVPFNEEGQMQTALLSGAIDSMISNPGSIMGQIEGGQTSALLFTGPERLDALPDVPTSEELGISGIPSMPRGLILPPEAPEEAQQWWIKTMRQVVKTPEWKKYLEENFLLKDEKWGEDFTAYLEDTQTSFQKRLTDLGAL